MLFMRMAVVDVATMLILALLRVYWTVAYLIIDLSLRRRFLSVEHPGKIYCTPTKFSRAILISRIDIASNLPPDGRVSIMTVCMTSWWSTSLNSVRELRGS